MLPDVMFGCLHQALGGGVPAEGTSCLWNLFALGGPGATDGDPAETVHATPFSVMSFHSGGTGARPGSDGLSATAFPSGVRNVPIEINEAVSPIVVWRKEYRQDSGGAGEFRGGLGQVMEVGTLDKRAVRASAPTTTASTIRRAAARAAWTAPPARLPGVGQASCAARACRRWPPASAS